MRKRFIYYDKPETPGGVPVNETQNILDMLDAVPPPEFDTVPPLQTAPSPASEAPADGTTPPSQPTELAPTKTAVPAAGGPPPGEAGILAEHVVAEPTIEDTLRAEIARLSGLVTSGQLESGTQQVYPAAVQPTVAAPVAPTAQPTLQPNDPMAMIQQVLTQGFLTPDELDSVIDKPELLNEAYKRSSTNFVQSIFQLLPTLVNQTVAVEIQKSKLVSTFYEMYGDLKPYSDFVRLTMSEVEKKDPTKTYKEIFAETAVDCRKRLGLKESPTVTPGAQPDGKPLPPAFAGSRSNSAKPAVAKPGTDNFFDSNALDILNLQGN